MKIVVAIDSLKGSLTSMEAGRAIKEGILKVMDAQVIVKPLADGGEGTTEALVEGLGGEMIHLNVMGPYGQTVTAGYGHIKESGIAIMEMAAAAGIILVDGKKFPMEATTFGVGEMIKDAIGRGYRKFIIGIGGSATNDGGIGMLSALGYRFLDEHGQALFKGAKVLHCIASIDKTDVLPELKDCIFQVACDVTNPLCGENGATYIYGPQKGITLPMLSQIDAGMRHFAAITKEYQINDFMETEGAGAAGGLGFAFLSYLNAKLESGVQLILKAVQIEDCLKDANYVITGEGRLDRQTVMGKAPVGVAKLAKKHGVKVIALAGSVSKDAVKCNEAGIDAYFCILNQIVTLEKAMEKETARSNMIDTTEQIFRLISVVNKQSNREDYTQTP